MIAANVAQRVRGGDSEQMNRLNCLIAALCALVPACGGRTTVKQDVSPWPVLTDRLPVFDTSMVVTLPADTFRYYRTDIQLVFRSGISDSARTEFFHRKSMIVQGVTPAGVFFVRIPDPGGSSDLLFQTVAALRAEPEIAVASAIARSAQGTR